MKHKPWSLVRDETGATAIWMALASVMMIVVVGLAIDLTGQVHAQQRLHDVAVQAARAGGQAVDPAKAIPGQDAAINPSAAVSAANSFLAQSGVSGNVQVTAGNKLTVTTQATYGTKVLSIIGINSLSVEAKAEARLARVVEGTER